MKRTSSALSEKEEQPGPIRKIIAQRQRQAQLANQRIRMGFPPFDVVAESTLNLSVHSKPPPTDSLRNLFVRANQTREAAARQPMMVNTKAPTNKTKFPWRDTLHNDLQTDKFHRPPATPLDCQRGKVNCGRVTLISDVAEKTYCTTYITGQYEPAMPTLGDQCAEDSRLFAEMLHTKRKYPISRPENQKHQSGQARVQQRPVRRMLPGENERYELQCRKAAAAQKPLVGRVNGSQQHPSLVAAPQATGIQQMHGRQRKQAPQQNRVSLHQSTQKNPKGLVPSSRALLPAQTSTRNTSQQRPTPEPSPSPPPPQVAQVQFDNLQQFQAYLQHRPAASAPQVPLGMIFRGRQDAPDAPEGMTETIRDLSQRSHESQRDRQPIPWPEPYPIGNPTPGQSQEKMSLDEP